MGGSAPCPSLAHPCQALTRRQCPFLSYLLHTLPTCWLLFSYLPSCHCRLPQAWQTPVLPKRYHGGRLLKVHAGYESLYLCCLALSDHCCAGLCCCRHAVWHTFCIVCSHWNPSATRFLCSFYHAFNANGFRQQLLQHIEEAVGSFSPEAGLRMHLTGAAQLPLVCRRSPSCKCCAPGRRGLSARPRRVCGGKLQKAARGRVATLRHRSSCIT